MSSALAVIPPRVEFLLNTGHPLLCDSAGRCHVTAHVHPKVGLQCGLVVVSVVDDLPFLFAAPVWVLDTMLFVFSEFFFKIFDLTAFCYCYCQSARIAVTVQTPRFLPACIAVTGRDDQVAQTVATSTQGSRACAESESDYLVLWGKGIMY
jgi:hypothetical protein